MDSPDEILQRTRPSRSLRKRLLILGGISAVLTVVVLFIVHSLEHNPAARAYHLASGMSKDEVRQIMGDPERVSTTAQDEEWQYEVSGEMDISLTVRPFRFSVFQRDWITVRFTSDGKLDWFWIPTGQ